MPNIAVSFLAPDRAQCGISDYSRRLLHELQILPDLEIVSTVRLPETHGSHMQAVARRTSIAREFRVAGAELSKPPALVAHVQHEFSLVGGIAPHKNHATALYSSITIPVVLTVHEIVEEAGSTLRRATLRHANRTNFLHDSIHAWIVHTASDRDRLAAIGARSEDIFVIPVGVPDAMPTGDRDAARAELGMEGKQVVTLFGFLSAKKGHFDAIAALELLPADVTLLLAGGKHPDDHTDYTARLHAEISSRGLEDRVHITGYAAEDRLPIIMAATDLAIAPYTSSSGSASLTQLIAAGLPVLASDIPAFREIAEGNPKMMELVAPNEPKLLADAIRALLADTTKLDAMRAASARYAHSNTYKDMAAATLDVYRSVIRRLPNSHGLVQGS